jgi:hypothetical protein
MEVNGQRGKDLSQINIANFTSSSITLQEFKKDQELLQISKLINPTVKGSSNQNTLYSHTMSSKMKSSMNKAAIPVISS